MKTTRKPANDRYADFGKLTSGLIHELVNPLTVISLNLEELASTNEKLKLFPKYYETVQNTLKKAVRATQRIEEYVMATQRQLQQQPIQQRFSVVREIKQVTRMYSYRCKKEEIALEMDVKQRPFLYGNPIQLSHCISNLISNACDAVEGRTCRRIVIRVLEKDGEVVIEVSDSGSGIAAKDRKHIFEPFYTTKSRAKGTGIGLAMMQDIVENSFKGKIEVESKLGKGTTFRLIFTIG